MQNIKSFFIVLSIFFSVLFLNAGNGSGRMSEPEEMKHPIYFELEKDNVAQLISFLEVNPEAISGFLAFHLPLLSQAIASKANKCVGELIERGADVNELIRDGKTLLHIAAEADCLYVTQKLIALEADKELKNNEGETPLCVALKKAIEKASASYTPLRLSDFKVANFLKEQGANAEAMDNDGKTINHYLWKLGELEGFASAMIIGNGTWA